MSDLADRYTIYEGVWTNWSHGRILGSTITLNRRDGGLLISFIALFVTFVGTALWRIICFALHHQLSSEAPRDALYHQQQAVLRNSANGGSGLLSLGQVLWTWRHHKTHRPYYRMLPTIILTALFLGSFAVAGIFSSKIATSTGTEVLVSSPHCSVKNRSAIDEITELTVMLPWEVQGTIDAANYAQKCYNGTSNKEDCRVYVKKQLPTTSNRNASCPFSKEMCKSDYGNIELDTGFIDSNDHLGVNSPPDKRVIFRSTYRCAPLAVENHETKVEYRSGDILTRHSRFYLGPGMNGTEHRDDSTFERWDYTNTSFEGDLYRTFSEDYSIKFLRALFANQSVIEANSDFKPGPQLWNPRANLDLFFLSANGIMFPQESGDPWYAAHRSFPVKIVGPSGPSNVDVYLADDVASVIGCSQQCQFCNPNLPSGQQCSPLAANTDAHLAASTLWPEPGRYKELEYLTYSFATFRPAITVQNLGISALTARYNLRGGVQAALPINQWQLETEYWFRSNLAAIQRMPVEFATGPSNPAVREFYVQPSPEVRYYCENQKVLTTAYTNFNTFGLCLTLALGVLVIITSYSLEPLTSCVQKRWPGLDKYSRVEWCTNETLQLQRLAHEELGVGTWRGGVDAVPITEAGERLGMLDLADLEHPRLKVPPAALDVVLAEETGGGRTKEGAKVPQQCCIGDTNLLPSSDSESTEGSARDA